MSEFKYQMHCHTFPCSHCADMTPKELAESLAESGYSGACITNHFFNGNSGIDRSLPWRDFVKAYEDDWLECQRFAKALDIDILFGIEEGVGGGLEILCYGITPDMLYAHPELHEKNAELWYNTLSPLGVLIVQAHPFREKDYISTPGVLPPNLIDGIEVFNCGHNPRFNITAAEFAKEHPELILTSGADAHIASKAALGGIAATERISTPEKLVEVLKSRKYSIITE